MNRALALLVLLLAVPACGGDDASSNPDGGGGGSGGSSSGGGTGGTGAGGSGTADVTVACAYPAKFTCGALTVHGAPAAQVATEMCTHDGGTPSGVCPAANLLGCCRQSIVENCFYAGGTVTAAKQEMVCVSGGGTWSTSP
jgi:hypothetical protein